MDLLGAADPVTDLQSNILNTQPIASTNNQDLLDLLGGLDTIAPPIATPNTGINFILENNNTSSLPILNNQNSNFLNEDLLSNNRVNGKYNKQINVENYPVLNVIHFLFM